MSVGLDIGTVTERMIGRWRSEHTAFVPGLGHRFHKPEDPRAPRLMDLVAKAAEVGTVSGNSGRIGHAVQDALNR